jgi:hypothetical protein
MCFSSVYQRHSLCNCGYGLYQSQSGSAPPSAGLSLDSPVSVGAATFAASPSAGCVAVSVDVAGGCGDAGDSGSAATTTVADTSNIPAKTIRYLIVNSSTLIYVFIGCRAKSRRCS